MEFEFKLLSGMMIPSPKCLSSSQNTPQSYFIHHPQNATLVSAQNSSRQSSNHSCANLMNSNTPMTNEWTVVPSTNEYTLPNLPTSEVIQDAAKLYGLKLHTAENANNYAPLKNLPDTLLYLDEHFSNSLNKQDNFPLEKPSIIEKKVENSLQFSTNEFFQLPTTSQFNFSINEIMSSIPISSLLPELKKNYQQEGVLSTITTNCKNNVDLTQQQYGLSSILQLQQLISQTNSQPFVNYFSKNNLLSQPRNPKNSQNTKKNCQQQTTIKQNLIENNCLQKTANIPFKNFSVIDISQNISENYYNQNYDTNKIDYKKVPNDKNQEDDEDIEINNAYLIERLSQKNEAVTKWLNNPANLFKESLKKDNEKHEKTLQTKKQTKQINENVEITSQNNLKRQKSLKMSDYLKNRLLKSSQLSGQLEQNLRSKTTKLPISSNTTIINGLSNLLQHETIESKKIFNFDNNIITVSNRSNKENCTKHIKTSTTIKQQGKRSGAFF